MIAENAKITIGKPFASMWSLDLRYHWPALDHRKVLHGQQWNKGDAACGMPFALLNSQMLVQPRYAMCILCARVALLSAQEVDYTAELVGIDFF